MLPALAAALLSTQFPTVLIWSFDVPAPSRKPASWEAFVARAARGNSQTGSGRTRRLCNDRDDAPFWEFGFMYTSDDLHSRWSFHQVPPKFGTWQIAERIRSAASLRDAVD
ncbi:hypothetical protein PG984_007406 [Apiospora sp. TS-2023a]